MLLANRPTNPRRPPDWRWRLGAALAEMKDRKRAGWDDRVLRVRRYVSASKRGRNLDRFDPALAAAVRVRGDAVRRGLLELLVLAGVSPDEIARRVGVSPEAVTAYEAAFYAVREAGPSYVAHVVLDLTSLDYAGLKTPKARAFLFGKAGLAGLNDAEGPRVAIDQILAVESQLDAVTALAALPLATARDQKLALRLFDLYRRVEMRRAESA